MQTPTRQNTNPTTAASCCAVRVVPNEGLITRGIVRIPPHQDQMEPEWIKPKRDSALRRDNLILCMDDSRRPKTCHLCRGWHMEIIRGREDGRLVRARHVWKKGYRSLGFTSDWITLGPKGSAWHDMAKDEGKKSRRPGVKGWRPWPLFPAAKKPDSRTHYRRSNRGDDRTAEVARVMAPGGSSAGTGGWESGIRGWGFGGGANPLGWNNTPACLSVCL